jgi:hypothetical protein
VIRSAFARKISNILSKLLKIQILIQKRKNGIVFDNDAKGCYDRIINGITLLSIRRLGYSKTSVHMLGKLWKKLEHHMNTGVLISDISYSSTVEKLIYGIGQETCSSPLLWALLPHLILKALEEKHDFITLVPNDKSKTSTRPGGSLVDYTITGTTEKKELTSDEEEW